MYYYIPTFTERPLPKIEQHPTSSPSTTARPMQEDKFNEQIAKVREDVRKEVETAEEAGDLDVGEAVVAGGAMIMKKFFGI